jgi:sec-independent protein translocase protein TatA
MIGGVIGTWELILIVVVVILLFGAKRLPEMARGIGKAVREFRSALEGHEQRQGGEGLPGAEDGRGSPPDGTSS